MNAWNYRDIKMKCDSQIYFAIAEVYYDEKNQPVGWVKCNENTLVFEEYENLKGTIELLSEAFSKPILTVVEGDKLVLR